MNGSVPAENSVNATLEKQLVYLVVNSSAVFFFTYLISYLFIQFITMLVGDLFGIRSYLTYYEIVFAAGSEWNTQNITIITTAGPFISLLVGFLLLLLIKKRHRHYSSLINQILFWTGFHCINFFTGGIIAGTITGRGFGYAIDLIFWQPVVFYIILDVIMFAAMTVFGYKCARLFLLSVPSTDWLKDRRKRSLFIAASSVLPWMICSLIIFLLKLPFHQPQHSHIVFHDMILLVTMGFMVIPMIFNRNEFRVQKRSSQELKTTNINWQFCVVTMVLILCFRIFLTEGFRLLSFY